MLFETKQNLHIADANASDANDYVNYFNKDTTSGVEALNYYANTPCPASQLIDAESPEQLQELKIQVINNFNNKQWLESNLHPYL